LDAYLIQEHEVTGKKGKDRAKEILISIKKASQELLEELEEE